MLVFPKSDERRILVVYADRWGLLALPRVARHVAVTLRSYRKLFFPIQNQGFEYMAWPGLGMAWHGLLGYVLPSLGMSIARYGSV